MQSRCRIEEENQGKCTRQSVPIVAKNAKYHSHPIRADLSTARTVGQREDPQEETDTKRLKVLQ